MPPLIHLCSVSKYFQPEVKIYLSNQLPKKYISWVNKLEKIELNLTKSIFNASTELK